MVPEEAIEKTLEFMSTITHAGAIANDKIVLRNFFHKLEKTRIIDSFAIDYTEENFRFSLIKCPEERIFLFKTDNTIEEVE